jgi:hypothetical protein
MSKANLVGKICALSLSLAVAPLAACSATSGNATAPRSQSPAIALASDSRATVQAPPAAKPHQRASSQHRSATVALGQAQPSGSVSDSRTELSKVPCQLEISEEAGSMMLDFHAAGVPRQKVRKEVKQLVAYLNQNRGDAEVSGAPNGRPEPATFAVRKILEARPVARSDDLIDGARLTLTPADPAARRELQARVLWYAADLLPGLPLRGKVCPELPPQVQARVAATE